MIDQRLWHEGQELGDDDEVQCYDFGLGCASTLPELGMPLSDFAFARIKMVAITSDGADFRATTPPKN